MEDLIDNPYYQKHRGGFTTSGIYTNRTLNESHAFHVTGDAVFDVSKENTAKVSEMFFTLQLLINDILSNEQQASLIRRCPSSIRLLENPSYELVKQAIVLDPTTIQYIETPSEELQILAGVRGIEHIKGQVCKKLQLIAIETSKHHMYDYFPKTYPSVLKLHEFMWEL